ncbi:MAG: GDP-mannose 4,6-dehydratase, partial [Gemmatimonadota bacterium]
AQRDAFRFVDADVRDPEHLLALFSEADTVIHLAARPGVRSSFDDPGAYVGLNVWGTAAVLEACRRAGVSRVVTASSSSVYGETVPAPFAEDARDLRPTSPYARSKLAAERVCQRHAARDGLQIAVLRFFSVYGPRQRPDQAIMRFTHQLVGGGALERYGDGRAERDYTHVDDVVQGILRAVQWTACAAPGCEIFNIGSGRPVALEEVIALIGRAGGAKPRIAARPEQWGDVRRTHADISKARAILGYEPRVSIEDGIARFVTWYEDTYGFEPRATA